MVSLIILIIMIIIIICKFITRTKSSLLESEAPAVTRWPDGVC